MPATGARGSRAVEMPAGVSMYGLSEGKPVQYAFCNEDGPQTIAVEGLLGEAPRAG
jgi:hypothetical protein